MSNQSSPDRDKLAERVTGLETVVTHLERSVQDLDEMLRAQTKRLDLLARQSAALTSELGNLRVASAEVPKPEDEKPPHY